MTNEIKKNEEATCDDCGRYGAYEIGGKNLCADCYQISGTCGGGGDDSDEK